MTRETLLPEAWWATDFPPEATPLIVVLDSDVVRRGLDHHLRFGTEPLSLAAARGQALHLFLERRTFVELVNRKLADFALQMGRQVDELKHVFATYWLPFLRVVDLSGEPIVDARVLQVPEDDRPAAHLASMVAPCLLMTDNHHDFRPMGVASHSSWLPGVKGAEQIARAESEQAGAGFAVSLPLVLVGSGAQWGARRIPGPTWAKVLGGVGVAGVAGYLVLRDTRRRERLGKLLWAPLEPLLAVYAEAITRRESGLLLIQNVALVSPVRITATSLVMRKLAMATMPTSAREIWQGLDRTERRMTGSELDVRQLLRNAKGLIFQEPRRGRWLLGQTFQLLSEVQGRERT